MVQPWHEEAIYEMQHPIPTSGPFSGFNVPTYSSVSAGNTWRAQWRLSQSDAAYGDGIYPFEDAAAIGCAVTHAAELHHGFQFSWDPGECDAVVPRSGMIGGGSGSSVGLALSKFVPILFSGASLTASVSTVASRAYINQFGRIPTRVRTAVAGYMAAYAEFQAGTRAIPEMERVSVDATVAASSVSSGDVVPTVGYYLGVDDGFTSGSPVSRLGSLIGSVSGAAGSVGSVATIPNVQPGVGVRVDFQTVDLVAGAIPGVDHSAQAVIKVQWDWRWTIRWRRGELLAKQPLRWRQRDDGLGLSAVARQRRGSSSSLQASLRNKGGYR